MPLKIYSVNLSQQFFILILLSCIAIPLTSTSMANTYGHPTLELSKQTSSSIDLHNWLLIQTQQNIDNLTALERLPSNSWRNLTSKDTRLLGASNMWVTFNVTAPDDYLSRIIALDNPLLDSITLYHKIDGKLVNTVKMGDSYEFNKRPLQSNTFLFPFELTPGENHQFLFNINTNGNPNLPLVLWSSNELTQVIETENLLNGLQIGTLVAIGIFSLFIALASNSFSFSYYTGYVLSMTVLMSTVHGVSFRYLWPEWPQMQNVIFPIIIPMILGFNLMFSEKVLQLKYFDLTMLKYCRLMAATCFMLTIILPFISYGLAIWILMLAVTIVCLALTIFAIIQAIKGHQNARLYAIGRISLLFGSVISGAIYFGLFDIGLAMQTPIMLGVTIEVITMAAVLAIRYNDERKAKLAIQQQALEQAERLRETREEALKAEAEANERLEQMVQERTLELEITLRELGEVNQKLTQQNTVDSLTGVKNRGVFDKRLIAEGRISRRQQTPMAILMLDIDKFKEINDRYGHLAGDHTLQIIGRTLSDNLKRPTDLVSRFGGEEFAIILPNTDEHGAIQVAETIRQAIENLAIKWDSLDIPLTISIGVSVAIIDSDQHPTMLLAQADKALYQAKRTGRNKVCPYTLELENNKQSE
ncbi:sensor domain-containing diguanylate cyclase [Shewanella gaetbuli]|uniref:diguanylate cyclase n=1 Tax=Shewanella gaetbuli TaxID=220752 RepID=A0A9X1ZJH8_9GAMM|nr:diguanylate cyclase [Shewanella gaetbuli]MCL1142137.1 sensor domain-containing diguanylate cyclase [Shewanella gaetbuli]